MLEVCRGALLSLRYPAAKIPKSPYLRELVHGTLISLEGKLSATRALKNLRWLRKNDSELFGKSLPKDGRESGISIGVASRLHLLRFPLVTGKVSSPLFSGTMHFVQIGFTITSGSKSPISASVPRGDLEVAIAYAKLAAPQLSRYAGQYGQNSIEISSDILPYEVGLKSRSYSDADVQLWVNAIKDTHKLPASDALAILNPITVTNASADPFNGMPPCFGYHGTADMPYLFVNVLGTGLSINDAANVYAVTLSHEIVELTVDPGTDVEMLEVCDPCAGDNQYLVYFDKNGSFVGSDKSRSPGSAYAPGFEYAFFTSTVVKPGSATVNPVPEADCAYPPPPVS
jgi:hypothetical protein